MKAVQQWWSGMEYLITPYFLSVADRIDFNQANNEWPLLKKYPESEAEIRMEDSFFKIGNSEKPYSIAYPLFAISEYVTAREFDYPFVRAIDEKGFMSPEGTLILDRAMQAHFDGCVQLIKTFSKSKSVSITELALFLSRLRHYCKYNPEQSYALVCLKEELEIPDTDYEFVYEAIGGATTNAKAIKNIVNFIEQKELLVTQATEVLLKLRGLLGDLAGKKITNLVPTFRRADKLFIGHRHPMVRDQYLVCINQILNMLFQYNLKKREKDCLDYLEILIDAKVNLDINLARKAVLEYALKLDTAEDTWEKLKGLTSYTKKKLPLIDSRYDELEVEDWRKHALNHISDMRK
ncbi:hypothetical protein OAE12_00505 [bacterium]|nr:hypothetical protein [bacterium]